MREVINAERNNRQANVWDCVNEGEFIWAIKENRRCAAYSKIIDRDTSIS